MEQIIKDEWKKLFPHSEPGSQLGAMDKTTIYFRGYLSADRNECPSNIRENDPLYYRGAYNKETNSFKESACSIYTAAAPGSFNALGRANLRLKTIKDVTPEKLAKRFKQIFDELLVPNVSNFHSGQAKLQIIYEQMLPD
jgi:hypothetical protein